MTSNCKTSIFPISQNVLLVFVIDQGMHKHAIQNKVKFFSSLKKVNKQKRQKSKIDVSRTTLNTQKK